MQPLQYVIMTAIQEALINKMTTNNLSQSQLAQNLGIKPCLLSLIINGKRTPSLEVVKAIYCQYPDLVDILLK
jgi:transcriptional regulator with XRE-family HTH domain